MGISQETSKFRDLADLSDDEETDMDVSTDDTDGDDDAPNKTKITRTQSTNRADGDSVPKWSNPDPYTVLPPPEETTGKRIDFVKLIRKAKNSVAEQSDATNAVAANHDFISFGDDDNEDASEPLVIPTEPASYRSQHLQGSLNEVAATGSLESAINPMKRSAEIAGLPARPPVGNGSRKRKKTSDYAGKKREWVLRDERDPAPWAYRNDYERLRDQPEKL
jgi:non-canonical poly(A) RNA polymerase PAPD5/7